MHKLTLISGAKKSLTVCSEICWHLLVKRVRKQISVSHTENMRGKVSP